MKRSRINELMLSAIEFIRGSGFRLPPFAYWSPDNWRDKGPEAMEIPQNDLGWDITDFGHGEFEKTGLILFTLRNGNHRDPESKPYAEKIMVAEDNQETPMHFHWSKTEDIINRFGAKLAIELFMSTEDEALDTVTPVSVSIDGIRHEFKPGTVVELEPGESITLTPRLYHRFWGLGGRVLIGEVSAVNDDHDDNRFLLPQGRFPAVEEDEEPCHLLVGDYARYYRG
ncbi:MAG: D-lyxose/D-mannose family sugar isomerase [Chloroflexi bacterium]|nr:D-lyxose/D-mannose family sugar isomerase [Chloroflexota bacterium]